MSSENPVRYSVVVPVYRNQETLAAVIERLETLAAELDRPLEAVFVVDGSPDGSLELLRVRLQQEHRFSAQLIALSRNFGSFSAVKAGLGAAPGAVLPGMRAPPRGPAPPLPGFFAATG